MKSAQKVLRSSMLTDFKAFIMKGNVVDMAVGIIIGAAFGAIVTSIVKDVIMPPIGLALGNIDFSNLSHRTSEFRQLHDKYHGSYNTKTPSP